MDNDNNGTPEVPTPAIEDGWHPSADNLTVSLYRDNVAIIAANASEAAYRLGVYERNIERLETRNRELESEQIHGSDPRLADFWAKAQELADKANHCEVFDQIAEALGGPSRFKEFEVTVDFYVTVPVSLSISVEARDEYDACEQAIELAQGYGSSDLENNADFWNAEIQRDTFEAEASEV